MTRGQGAIYARAMHSIPQSHRARVPRGSANNEISGIKETLTFV